MEQRRLPLGPYITKEHVYQEGLAYLKKAGKDSWMIDQWWPLQVDCLVEYLNRSVEHQ